MHINENGKALSLHDGCLSVFFVITLRIVVQNLYAANG